MKNILEFWIEHSIGRSLTEIQGVYSINNMNDTELAQSIIEDIMFITIEEDRCDIRVRFGMTQLTNQLDNRNQKSRVQRILNSDLVQPYITKEYRTSMYPDFRLKKDYNVRRAAMEFCGVYIFGYGFPGMEDYDNTEPNLLDALFERYNKKKQVKLTDAEITDSTTEFFKTTHDTDLNEVVFEIASETLATSSQKSGTLH